MSEPWQSADPPLIGRYEVRHKVGAGATGVVYAAYDPELEREVAVKLLRRDRLLATPEASERLRHEARITARLAHPNVVTIYDVGSHENAVYITMELVHGPSMRKWLGDIARPWREVVAMFFQAGLGLAAAHEAGLIHRDFKPANVLIGDRRARVVDFGLARAGSVRPSTPSLDSGGDIMSTAPSEASATRPAMEIADVLDTIPSGDERSAASLLERAALKGDALVATLESAVEVSGVAMTQRGPHMKGRGPEITHTNFVGTPAYMAPELFTGGIADARTDQFAFCVALYEGVYGHRPFAGETLPEIASQVLAGNIRSTPGRTRVPSWMRDIIIKGLAVDPDERHASMRSMLAAIGFVSRIMSD